MGWGGDEEEEEVLVEAEELMSLTPVTRAGPGLVRLLSGTETHMTRGAWVLYRAEAVISEMATWSEREERMVSGPWETPGGQMKIARYQWKIIKLETSRNGSLFTTSQFLFSLLGERISLK